MLKITLSSQQKTDSELHYKKMHDVRNCDCIKAVLLKSKDRPKALRNIEFSINRYQNNYRQKKKLTPENATIYGLIAISANIRKGTKFLVLYGVSKPCYTG
ncbi:MAG: hypothetical protein QS721_03100 [Candidatus Endonucleobacter sp. (ex Gigantidas childressi)]|nr:hypothetical protein [Candidatus Endonucleobacter sp. (ex Gigantidas childressi)]